MDAYWMPTLPTFAPVAHRRWSGTSRIRPWTARRLGPPPWTARRLGSPAAVRGGRCPDGRGGPTEHHIASDFIRFHRASNRIKWFMRTVRTASPLLKTVHAPVSVETENASWDPRPAGRILRFLARNLRFYKRDRQVTSKLGRRCPVGVHTGAVQLCVAT